jgi:proline iminopeptidase
VYLYDQAGSGASPFLHVKDYAIARFVEDLEAIRLQLHTERMILIGHSWGAALAASYMARYADHVSKVVFISPVPIWNIEDVHTDVSATDAAPDTDVHVNAGLPPLRFLAGLYLMQQNPDAAENLLPQREIEEFFAPLQEQFVASLVCKGASNKLPRSIVNVKDRFDNPGLNPYVLVRLQDQTEVAADDPHAALRGHRTPAILLRAECDFLPWGTDMDYRKTIADLKIFYIPKAGHMLFEQPELMLSVIRAFLLDQPDVMAPYTEDVDPRGVAAANTSPTGR